MPLDFDLVSPASRVATGVAVFGFGFFVSLAGLRVVRARLEALASRYADHLDKAAASSRVLDDVGPLPGWVGGLAAGVRSHLGVAALLCIIVGALVLGLIGGQLVLTCFVVALVVGFPYLLAWTLEHFERRRMRLIEESLPDAIMLITSSLAAGLAFPAALASAAAHLKGPLSTEARITSNEIFTGASIGRALHDMVRRTPSHYLGLFAAAAAVHVERGGNLAESLKQLGGALTRILLSEGELRAKTAGSRREMVIVTLVPAVVLPIGIVIEPRMFLSLFLTLGGRVILGLAVIIWIWCARGLYNASHREV